MMKNILLDSRMPDRYRVEFEKRGFNTVMLPPYRKSAEPVSCHPDMIAAVTGGKILMPRDYYEDNRAAFAGLKIIVTDEIIGEKYPSDILLNALVIGDTVYGRSEISELIKAGARRFVKIRQGYARCSTLLLDNRAAVTADRGIARALNADGIAVLEIEAGNIALDGYSYGFIGGAAAVIDNEILCYGDITAHPDYGRIVEFTSHYGFTPVPLSADRLYDYGGAVVVSSDIQPDRVADSGW